MITKIANFAATGTNRWEIASAARPLFYDSDIQEAEARGKHPLESNRWNQLATQMRNANNTAKWLADSINPRSNIIDRVNTLKNALSGRYTEALGEKKSDAVVNRIDRLFSEDKFIPIFGDQITKPLTADEKQLVNTITDVDNKKKNYWKNYFNRSKKNPATNLSREDIIKYYGPEFAGPEPKQKKSNVGDYATALGTYLSEKVRNAVQYGRNFLRDSANGYNDLYNFVTDKNFRRQLGFSW